MDLENIGSVEDIAAQVSEFFSDAPAAEEVVQSEEEAPADENQDAPTESEGAEPPAEAPAEEQPIAAPAEGVEQVADPAAPTAEVSEIEALKQQMAEMQAAYTQLLVKQMAPAVETPAAPAATQQPPQDIKFFETDDAHTEAIQSVDSMNKALNKVMQVTLETAYRNVMPVVNKVVSESLEVHSRARSFYDDNPDLAASVDLKNAVAAVADEVQRLNPTLPLDQILQETGKIVRQRLKMPKPSALPATQANNTLGVKVPAVPAAQRPAARPAFATPNSTRRPAGGGPKGVSDLAAEIAETLDL
jgi:hypothetical protein